MDYKKLCEPYAENGRTPEGQIAWLTKKSIPKAIIEQAMLYTYDEMERGRAYENGHELDRALFARAQTLEKEAALASLRLMEEYHQKLRDQWGEDLQKVASATKKTPLWKRILTLGLI